MPYPCLRGDAGATLIEIYAAPNAKRTEISGWFDTALRVRLAAQPIEGRANEALGRWLADELDIPMRSVSLVSGASARKKLWRVELPQSAVEAWLAGCALLNPG